LILTTVFLFLSDSLFVFVLFADSVLFPAFFPFFLLELSYSKMIYAIVHGLVILCLASIPSLLLNAPVGFAANYWAYREAKKDLKASRVKVAARDVLLSKKIVFSLMAVPLLWVFYAFLAFFCTNWRLRTIFVLFLCFPIFSYLGVMAVEASMADLKDLRPAFLRLMPAFREQAVELPKLRLALKKEIRELVQKYGPEVGPAYLDASENWEQSALSQLSSLGGASPGTVAEEETKKSGGAGARKEGKEGKGKKGDKKSSRLSYSEKERRVAEQLANSDNEGENGRDVDDRDYENAAEMLGNSISSFSVERSLSDDKQYTNALMEELNNLNDNNEEAEEEGIEKKKKQ
jgi:hypothetical protein